LILLAVLFPIAVYLSVLGWINRRPRGLLLSGRWDFVGVLFAASGLLLLGGPALLSSVCLTEAWRNFWIMGKWSGDAGVEESLALGRAILFGTYFLVVVLSCGLILWRRRRLTALYNVDPAVVERVLGEVFAARQMQFVQMGNVLVIDSERPPTLLTTAEDGLPAVAPATVIEEPLTLEVEASARMSHVSLWWNPPDSLLRRELEMQLRHALARERAPGGPIGDWLLLASSLLFFLLLLGAGVLVLLRFTRG
jgi:hypothetical protein